MNQDIIIAINKELEANGVNSIESLINSGIQVPIIFNLLYSNSKTFRSKDKKEMLLCIENINCNNIKTSKKIK